MRARTIPFRSDGLELAAELVAPDDARALLVLCHGIPSGRPPDPADAGYAGLARELAARGYAAAWFNFRGCRDAPGDFSLGGWCADLDAAIDAVAARHDVAALPRVIVGSSAGGAVAILVGARREDVAAVATLAAVASFRLGDLVEPARFLHECRTVGIIRDPAFPTDPAGWADEFEDLAPDRAVSGLAPRPLLLVHGDADDVVPYEHAERLFDAAEAPKELVRIPRAAHQLRRDPRAVEALLDWLGMRLAVARHPA